MRVTPRQWVVSFYLSNDLELHEARVCLEDIAGKREIVRMITGPFDSPDEVLSTILELIDHAEWKGEQLRLPVAPAE